MRNLRLDYQQKRYLRALDRDCSALVDAIVELQNNAQRGEQEFLRRNLTAAFTLAARIGRRRTSGKRLLLTGKIRR